MDKARNDILVARKTVRGQVVSHPAPRMNLLVVSSILCFDLFIFDRMRVDLFVHGDVKMFMHGCFE